MQICKLLSADSSYYILVVFFSSQNQNCLSDLHYHEEMCEEAYLLLKTIAKKLCAQVRLQDLREEVIKLKDKVKLRGFRLVLLLFTIALSHICIGLIRSDYNRDNTLLALVGS